MARAVDVDVDQATGNVYALNEVGAIPAGAKAIVEYSADGSEVIARFGEKAAAGKTTAETPDKIHDLALPGGDRGDGRGRCLRLRHQHPRQLLPPADEVRAPEPGGLRTLRLRGDEGADVAAGFWGKATSRANRWPMPPGTSTSAGENFIEEYDPSHPDDPPLCHYDFAKGGIRSDHRDPTSGEVFFSTLKKRRRQFHAGATARPVRSSERGEFEEIGRFEVKPESGDLSAAWRSIRHSASRRR